VVKKINLLAIMISHIARIANTFKYHDMVGYGFFLTSVFEELGIPLQNRVGFQVSDEIGSCTLIGCGFKLTKGISAISEQGPQTPFGPVPGSTPTSNTPTFDTLVQDQILLKGEITEVKQALTEEKGYQCEVSRGSPKCHFFPHGQIHFPILLFLTCSCSLFPTLMLSFKRLIVHMTNNGL